MLTLLMDHYQFLRPVKIKHMANQGYVCCDQRYHYKIAYCYVMYHIYLKFNLVQKGHTSDCKSNGPLDNNHEPLRFGFSRAETKTLDVYSSGHWLYLTQPLARIH